MPSPVLQGFFPAGPARPSEAGAIQPKSLGPARPLPPAWRPAATPGERLPPAVQAKMEGLFGADFSTVRVHVGPEATALGALAFTLGSHLYFAPGHYNPATPHGQRLLGHELAHVVQQRAGRVRNPFASGVAVVQDPRLEAEAERMGGRAVSALLQPYRQPAPSRALPSGTLQKASAGATAPPTGGTSPAAAAAAGGAASGTGALPAEVSAAAIQHVVDGHTMDGIRAYARSQRKLLSQGNGTIAVFAGGAAEVKRVESQIDGRSLAWASESGGRRTAIYGNYKIIGRVSVDGSRVEVETFFPRSTACQISVGQLENQLGLAARDRWKVADWRGGASSTSASPTGTGGAAAAAAGPVVMPPSSGGGGGGAGAPAKVAASPTSTGSAAAAAPRPIVTPSSGGGGGGGGGTGAPAKHAPPTAADPSAHAGARPRRTHRGGRRRRGR